MKKLISLLVILAMVCCMFAACDGNEDTTGTTTAPTETNGPSETTGCDDGTVKITDGYYFYTVEGRDCYIHFSEDGTYYGSYFGGAITDAGLWELVDVATDYIVDEDGNGMGSADDGEPSATSEQSIALTSYTRGETQYVAYADDALQCFYMQVGTRTLLHVPDYVYDMDSETAIQLYVYYANNDIGANFILNHNRTFEDVTGDTFETGTWEMVGTGEYALTYDFEGSTATLKADGSTATLTKADGAVVELKDDYKEEVVRTTLMVLSNDTFTVQGLAAMVYLYGYDDGVCELYVDLGQYGSSVVDQGTYEVSATMKPTFTFDTAGVIEGTPDYASASAETGISITAQYTATTAVGDMDLTMVGNYNPNGISEGGDENTEVTVMGTMSLVDGVYTGSIDVSGNEIGVTIDATELAESGTTVVSAGGGTMTCTYTYDGTYLTLSGGEDATGYMAYFVDVILGAWEIK